ncbi:T9SS type A sorting domain-containing protein [Hymenobacter sp. ASUV-10]|uniref:T9SS type A sorting domain-containing protein n=1 Tax=Hymenobacter aranciens TaxID=3063996 RepID=A0ABT9BHW6_9BACT|nr:T9SS type A sorting domain-containing protein [Hymenobacter sp. ASUV-10]MDO7876236.1 T9SS type A sorting domain-containing protein [Hymenobacter sp. ASUV-10]
MTTRSIPFIRLGRRAGLLALLLLPLLGWGQTTIAIQDFEATPATPTATYGTTGTGGAITTGNANTPNDPRYVSGTQGYGRSGSTGSVVITSAANIDASAYTGVALEFRLASFSGTSGNGAENDDLVTVAISTNGGTSYSNELIVTGNSNARWSFATGTGTASAAYDGNSTVEAAKRFTPAGGDARTTDGYTFIRVTGITASNQLRFRITLGNDAANEQWVIDDIVVKGNAAISTGTVGSTPVCANTATDVTVPYTPNITFTGAYSAQLSDAAGDFTSPTTLSIVGSNSANPLTVTIPAGTPNGTGYKIRVNNAAPARTGSASPAFAINNLAVTLAPTTLGLTIGQTNATALTATETPAATSRIWKYGTMSGGAYSNTIGSQAGTSYTPQPADFGGTTGTYYVVAQSTLGGCVVTSNQSVVTVNPATSATISLSTASLNLGTVGTNTAGTIYTYTVSGSLLTTGITITPPAGVEISKDGFLSTANTNAAPLVLPQSGNSVASTTISVRLAATATPGAVSGNITHVSGTASQNVAVTGTVLAGASACLTEGFNNAAIPVGWLTSGVSTSTDSPRTGTRQAEFDGSTESLTTPVIANPSLLTFYLYRTTSTTAKNLLVQVSTSGQTGTFTTVTTFTHSDVPLTETWTPLTVDLSAYTASNAVYIRFARNNGNTSPWRLDDVTVSCGVPAPAFTLTTGTIADSPFCINQGTNPSITVPFTVSGGTFGTANVMTAVLSNASGSFASGTTTLGTLTAVASGSISGNIPNSVVSGTAYRVRVQASTPATNAPDNGTDLVVTNYLTNEVPATASATPGNGQVTVSFGAPANSCATSVIITARLGSAGTLKPLAGNIYTANTTFGGSGSTNLGSGQYVVYNGPLNGSVTVTGLTNGSQYFFQIFTTGGNGYSDGIVRSARPVVPAILTEVLVPQLISARTSTSTHNARLPYVWRATVSGLLPTTTYKYYTAVHAATDAATYGGVGVPLEVKAPGAFVRASGPSLSSSTATFATDASGSYTGWFAVEPTADSRFADGSTVYPLIVLNAGDGSDVAAQFLPTTSAVTAMQLGTGSSQATAVRGTSFAAPANFIFTYNDVNGMSRPLAGTWVEEDGIVNTTANNYAAFYSNDVNGVAGAWGLLTPNTNANGIRRVEQRALADGSLVGCPATDADGVWPSTTSTVNPNSGTTARVLTTGDVPFQAATVTGFSPSGGTPGTIITITGTNFTTGPAPTVSFNGGTAVATTFVSTTSVTVAVPASASSGPLTLTAGCGTTLAVGAFAVVPNAYYTKATGDLDLLSTYGDQPDGSGTAPTSFALAGTTYTVTGTGRSFGNNWTVSGTGTKVVLAAGAEMIIPTTAVFAGTLDQGANSTLVIRNATAAATDNLLQDVQAASSTIELAQTTAPYIIPVDLNYENLKLTNGEKRLNAAYFYDVNGTLTLENTLISSTLLNTSAGNNFAYAIIRLNGNLVQLSNVTYDPARSITLQLLNTSTIQTLNANGGTISLHRLLTDGSTVKGGSLVGAGSVLALGNSRNGGLEMLDSGNTLELGAGTTLRFNGGGNIFGTSLGSLKPDPAANLEFMRTVANDYDLGSLRFVTGFNTVNNFLLSATTSVSSENVLGLSSNLTVNGSATFQAGTLELNGRTLTLNGPITSGTGTLRGSTSSSLNFGGTGALGTLNFVSAAAGRNLSTLTMNRAGGAAFVLTAPLTINTTLALTNGIITTDATNVLTLINAAAPTGGSADSYINGPLARITNSGARTVFFPVGKAGNYRPLTLNTAAQSNTVTYTAEQIESAPANNNYAAGSNLQRVSFKRYFTINRSTSAGTFSGTLTMTFGTDDYVNFPADPTFVVAKRSTPASEWTNIGHTAETGTASNGAPVAGTITSGIFTTFSDFSLASTSTANFFPGLNPLPVELISFTAQRQEANVSLQWATASEKNSAYFEVQRSPNAEDFTTIAKVDAAGSSTKKAVYQTLDRNAPPTQLYYRLRQVDNDGSVAYSPVKVVAASSKVFEMAIYPNPARETINFSTAGPASYRISNVLGQVLLQGTATDMTNVSVASLASGTYYLELQTAAGRKVQKFSKE